MTPRLILIKCLTLLVRDAELENTDPQKTADTVRAVIQTIRFPDLNVSLDPESRVLTGIKTLIMSLTENGAINSLSIDAVLQQVEEFSDTDYALVQTIKNSIDGEMPTNRLKRMVVSLRQEMDNYLREKTAEALMQKALNKVRFERNDITDFGKFLGEVIASLEPYQREAVEKDPAIIDEINFDNVQDLADVYKRVKEEATGARILKTGWQEVNDMMCGGIRRGDEIMSAGLQHQYKTGFSLTVFKQLLMYNDAKEHLIDPTKKPLMVRISFEDTIENNLKFLYCNMIENDTGVWPEDTDVDKLTPEEIAEFVMSRLRSMGWEVRMLRVDPTQWTYIDLLNKLTMYEAEGYEIAFVMVDYLKMLPTTGCVQGIAGFDVRDLFRRIRNFCNPRKIAFWTPHQLSTEAKNLLRQGQPDFIKFVAGKGYYDGSKTIDHELDLEIFHHIETYNGQSFLAIQRGKHRKIGVTPQEDLYVLLPFSARGGILDNINGPKTGRRKLQGGVIGTTTERPLWDLGDDF